MFPPKQSFFGVFPVLPVFRGSGLHGSLRSASVRWWAQDAAHLCQRSINGSRRCKLWMMLGLIPEHIFGKFTKGLELGGYFLLDSPQFLHDRFRFHTTTSFLLSPTIHRRFAHPGGRTLRSQGFRSSCELLTQFTLYIFPWEELRFNRFNLLTAFIQYRFMSGWRFKFICRCDYACPKHIHRMKFLLVRHLSCCFHHCWHEISA